MCCGQSLGSKRRPPRGPKPVIKWRDNRDGTNSQFVVVLAGGHRLTNVRLGRSCQDWHSPVNLVGDDLHDPTPFLNRETGEFPGRSIGIETVHATIDQPIDYRRNSDSLISPRWSSGTRLGVKIPVSLFMVHSIKIVSGEAAEQEGSSLTEDTGTGDTGWGKDRGNSASRAGWDELDGGAGRRFWTRLRRFTFPGKRAQRSRPRHHSHHQHPDRNTAQETGNRGGHSHPAGRQSHPGTPHRSECSRQAAMRRQRQTRREPVCRHDRDDRNRRRPKREPWYRRSASNDHRKWPRPAPHRGPQQNGIVGDRCSHQFPGNPHRARGINKAIVEKELPVARAMAAASTNEIAGIHSGGSCLPVTSTR
ncbi:MAG: hypothetical protein CM1200mP2_14880 [Planctomycetaceae bacterium]|nr:MAG: hypothetical protein CM1200mP2_14880 [Planctomycetaceae bacterium]